MRQLSKLLFNAQHRTPILPQSPIVLAKDPSAPIRVGYLLSRYPTIKSEPHPLESEMAFTLQREGSRYSRHEQETLTHFMAAREHSIDSWNRTDPAQITSNFFGLEMYQDSLKTVLNRYKPAPRMIPGDFIDIKAEQQLSEPPKRQTLQRQLGDYLFLIVKDGTSGKWTVPSIEREEHETLRMTLDRAVNDHHNGGLDTFTWSNAPQAVVTSATFLEGKASAPRTFIYNVVYLAGRPDFAKLGCSDHAWVTRNELAHYVGSYETPQLHSILRDIAPDAAFEQQ
eukprot:GILI01031595.1.p1 GENE.GILI01031595.1~~GILI01031595.1.p1  ORF type:complete len:295 (-),score=34.93 GILI01031595.1:50-898(-)